MLEKLYNIIINQIFLYKLLIIWNQNQNIQDKKMSDEMQLKFKNIT
jgi:hypothetical protein